LANNQQTTQLFQVTQDWVRISHPQHPFYDQKVKIIRVRKRTPLELVVKLPTGSNIAISASFTDYPQAPPVNGPTLPKQPLTHLPFLELQSLQELANLVSLLLGRLES
jgi:hypothetical protein